MVQDKPSVHAPQGLVFHALPTSSYKISGNRPDGFSNRIFHYFSTFFEYDMFSFCRNECGCSYKTVGSEHKTRFVLFSIVRIILFSITNDFFSAKAKSFDLLITLCTAAKRHAGC
jgi:hypothetical protein